MNAALPNPATRLRVLVVDDSQAALEAICSYVQRDRKFEVVEIATDGCAALQRARSCAPDLVVVDFDMPKLNGLEVIQALVAEFPGLPVILVSLHDMPELQRRSLEVGARAFVSKQELGEELPAVLNQIYNTLPLAR